MNALVEIHAGVCGFRSCATARSEDSQHVTLELSSDCDKIRKLSNVLKHADPFDAYTEIAMGHRGRLFSACHELLPGCCVGCVVPTGLFKAMQVAAGLALPADVTITLSRMESS